MSAAAIPDTIRPRLGRFVRLLASDQPHEVVAAASALKRTLASFGADLNDLGDVVEHPPAPVVILRNEMRPEARRARRTRPGDVNLDYAQRRNVTEALRRGIAGRRLSEWERGFALSIVDKLQGHDWRLTERQGETLARLLDKLGEGKAWV